MNDAAPPRRIWLCADDYGISPGVNRAIRDLIGLMTIGGVQLIMIGVLGEYIGKILSELKARPIYFVAEHSEKRADAAAAESVERTAAE